jgi:Ca-activated chloride channel homolog
MSTRIALLILLFSTAGLHSQNGPGTGAPPARKDTPAISVDVAVFDAHGKVVADLNRHDFEVLEDGKPQTIRAFTAASAPYNVLVLLDCGESTRDRLLLLTNAISRFVNQLRPGDRVEVAAFDSEVHVLLDWTAARNQEIQFDDKLICKNTDLYGALNWSLKEIRKVADRRGVVVFSNGFQSEIARQEVDVNGSAVKRIVPPAKDAAFQKLLKKVREGGSPFYFVAVDTDLNPGTRNTTPVQDLQQVRARAEQLAAVSGGRIVFPRESSEVVPLFLQIGRELGSSYSLTFSPQRPADSTYRTIDVRVRGENHLVQQSRRGYTASDPLPR